MPAALLLAFVVFVSGCTLGIAENEAGGGQIFGGGAITLIPEADRDPAPAVCGPTVADGTELCLATMEGTPTLVNFWASWCGPCAREIPELVDLHAEYADTADLVGVNVEDSEVNARSFERDQAVTYPSWHDDGSVIAGQFGGIAQEALPSTLLLDAEHRVALRLFGAVSADQVRPYLDQLISESS